jgi:hypothetical protein
MEKMENPESTIPFIVNLFTDKTPLYINNSASMAELSYI